MAGRLLLVLLGDTHKNKGDVMKEIIQLNLTEEESMILQAIVAVGTAVHPLRDTVTFEKELHCMKLLMDEWPEANGSLADKMVGLVDISIEMIKAK